VNIKATLQYAMKVKRGSRDIVPPTQNLGARRSWVINATPQPLNPRKRDAVTILQEAGWVPVPVWKGTEYLAPT
jgi:hypothetical protein